MLLGNLLNVTFDTTTVVVMGYHSDESEEEVELARYDGRDSIPKKYNSWAVSGVEIEDGDLIVHIE